jgi:hypothetical protein
MAKPRRLPPPSATAGNDALAQIQTPGIKWNIVAAIGAGVVIAWVTAFLLVPYLGYWAVGGVAVLTVALAGFGGWAYNYTRKQSRLLEILRGATDEEGRKAALEKLSQGDSKDAMNAVARAQLLAREDPRAAIEVLEAVDIDKAPSMSQDEIRAVLAQLYLVVGRAKDARPLVDKIKVEQAPVAKARAMYAAVAAETLARTGSPAEAKKILEAHRADDPEIADVAPMLYRAQVFTFMGTKNRGLARNAMAMLAQVEPNLLAPFVTKGSSADMQNMAKEVLAETGFQTRQKMKIQRKM